MFCNQIHKIVKTLEILFKQTKKMTKHILTISGKSNDLKYPILNL